MKNKLLKSIALLLVMALFFSACGKKEEPEIKSSSADTGLVRSDRRTEGQNTVGGVDIDPITSPVQDGGMEELGEGSIEAVLYGNTVFQVSYTAPFVSEIIPVRDPLQYFDTDSEYTAFYDQFSNTRFCLFLSSGDGTQDTYMSLYSDSRYFSCGIGREDNQGGSGEMLICPVVNGNTITFTITDRDIAYGDTSYYLNNSTLEDLCAMFRQASVYYNDSFVCLLDFARVFETKSLAELPEIPEEQRRYFAYEGNIVIIDMDYITKFTERIDPKDIKIYDAGDCDYYITVSGELGRSYFDKSVFSPNDRYIWLQFTDSVHNLYYDLRIGEYCGVDLYCWDYTNDIDSYYTIPESEYYCCTEYDSIGFIEVHINLKKQAEWINSLSVNHPYVVENGLIPEAIPALKTQINALAKGADIFFKDYSSILVIPSWYMDSRDICFKNDEGSFMFGKSDVTSTERILPEIQSIRIYPESPSDSEYFTFTGRNYRVLVAEIENVPALAPEWCTDTYMDTRYGDTTYALFGKGDPKSRNILTLNKVTVVVYTEYDSAGNRESGKVKIIYDNPGDAKNVLTSSYIAPAEYGEKNEILPEFIDALLDGTDKRYAPFKESFAYDFAVNGISDKYVINETYEQGFWSSDCIPEDYRRNIMASGFPYECYYPEMKYLATENGVRYFELTDAYLNGSNGYYDGALPPIVLSNAAYLEDNGSYRNGHVIEAEYTHKLSDYPDLLDNDTYELPAGVEDKEVKVKISTYSTLQKDVRDSYIEELTYTDEEWLDLDITKELQNLFPGVKLQPDRSNIQYETSINAIIPDGTPELALELVHTAKRAGFGNGSYEYSEESIYETDFGTTDKYYTYDEFVNKKDRIDSKHFRYTGYRIRSNLYDVYLLIEYTDPSEYYSGISIYYSN